MTQVPQGLFEAEHSTDGPSGPHVSPTEAREEFAAIDDQRLAGILDNLVDQVNGHYVAIAHDAAVVDKDD